MSRQNKNARNLQRAREFSKARQSGQKGPNKTQPQHGKRWTYRNNPEIQKRISEALKASTPAEDKSALRKVLKNAGGAAKD